MYHIINHICLLTTAICFQVIVEMTVCIYEIFLTS